MTYTEQAKQFKQTLRDEGNIECLFEHLPGVCFFVKDAHCKMIMCNEASLRVFGLKEKSEIIGKSEYDFFPKNLADPIYEDDLRVMKERRPIIDRMELIVDEAGFISWVTTNKLPLYKKNGSVGGLMGTTRILKHTDMTPAPYKRYSETLEYIRKNYNQPIQTETLARMNHLSISQFRNNFLKLFKLPPQKFIQKIRIQAASQKLISSQDSIATIAADCGFCDQSYFTRQFRSQIGISPAKYRRLHFRKN
jgi:PAS domain S-box-containing protein|tara:strand:+ start:995 stop:1744 length:750 start_codon:yes stop_codon:yes gene_type:complete